MDISIDTLIEQSGTPVSLPEVFRKINRLTQDPNSSMADISQITEKDIGLSSRLLKIVNSPYFGFPSSINSIARAITIIGTHDLRDLLLTTTTVDLLANKAHKHTHIRQLWKHSLYCAVISKLLAESLQQEHTECYFVSGLLHDVGRFILFRGIPETTHSAIDQARDSGQDSLNIERSLLGYTHTDIGRRIAEHWKLPDRVIETIAYHHQPELAQHFPFETSIIHIANHIANSFEDEAESAEKNTSRINPYAWKTSGLAMENINEVLNKVPEQFNELYDLLMPGVQAA